MTKAVFFDMNQTLLNLSLLKNQFDKHFEDKYVLKYWFAKLLHSSTIMGIMDEYRNFGELALGEFRKLPAYEDVRPALTMLKENNIRVIAVSNSSLAMMKEQLTNAGIIELVDAFYSVDQVKKYKPFKDIYLSTAKQEGLQAEDIAMVATHDWDLFGAKKAGLITAYIKRAEQIYHPFYAEADFNASNLTELIEQIIYLK